jgi:hypothetical protein
MQAAYVIKTCDLFADNQVTGSGTYVSAIVTFSALYQNLASLFINGSAETSCHSLQIVSLGTVSLPNNVCSAGYWALRGLLERSS